MSTTIPKGSKGGGLVKSPVPKGKQNFFFSGSSFWNTAVCHYMCWIAGSSDIATVIAAACGHIKVFSLRIMFGHNSTPMMDGSWRRPRTCLEAEQRWERDVLWRRGAWLVPPKYREWLIWVEENLGLNQAYLHGTDWISCPYWPPFWYGVDLKVKFVEKRYRSFGRRWAVIFSSSCTYTC